MKKSILIGTLGIVVFGSCTSISFGECKGADIAVKEITSLERSYEHNLSNEFNKDPLTAMQFYDTKHILLFDVVKSDSDVHGGLEVPPNKFVAHFKELGPAWVGKMEFLEMEVSACGDVGFVSLIQHYKGSNNGEPFEYYIRSTDGLKKIGDKWKIVHEHWSVPIDFSTQKAIMHADW